jgi:hypothetical protein
MLEYAKSFDTITYQVVLQMRRRVQLISSWKGRDVYLGETWIDSKLTFRNSEIRRMLAEDKAGREQLSKSVRRFCE